jgi:hypothetical protein
LRSQQVLNALILILCRYLPREMKNTCNAAEDIIAILGYASAHRISLDASMNGKKLRPSIVYAKRVNREASQLPKRSEDMHALLGISWILEIIFKIIIIVF